MLLIRLPLTGNPSSSSLQNEDPSARRDCGPLGHVGAGRLLPRRHRLHQTIRNHPARRALSVRRRDGRQPLAKALARISYAHKLKIEEVRGAWLRVSEGKTTGWVFAGNLAEQKPAENKGLDGLPVAASETSATAAARPLAPAAADYADRRGLAQARSDVEWMEHTSDGVTNDQVQAFRQAQKKGEFQ